MRRIAALAAGLALAACADRAPPVVVDRAATCPAAPPPVECPAFPSSGADLTVEAVQDAWLRAQAAHRTCRRAVEGWERAWRRCADLRDD